MKILASFGKYEFIKLEQASEVDQFIIPCGESAGDEGFDFFHGMGMTDYRRSFKAWLRRFPRPVLIIAAEEHTLVSWAFIEEWPETAMDGNPVYVLRSIETVKGLRKRKMGFRLLLLGSLQVPGYIIAKPLNQSAEKFFERNGFMHEDEFKRKVLDLSKNHGYLILPPFKKRELQKDAERYFDRLSDSL